MTDNPIAAAWAATGNRVALANDVFRRVNGSRKDWHTTPGVMAQGAEFLMRAVAAVIAFDTFTPDNDPYGEHDFGSLMIDGHKLFWKIDCYDREDMTKGSEDPADPTVTKRVLTIMLASEY